MICLHSSQEALVPKHVHSLIWLEYPYNMEANLKENKKEAAVSFMT